MVRFSPQVIPFMLTFVAMFYAAQGAFVAAVHLWYGESFRQVEFAMGEWRPNDGVPYVAGTIVGSSEPAPFHLPGKIVDGKRVLAEAPSVGYAAGRVVKVWYSPDAPLASYNGEGVNAVPVDALPERPGWGRLLASLGTTLLAAVVGLAVTVWVANRWARRIVFARPS